MIDHPLFLQAVIDDAKRRATAAGVKPGFVLGLDGKQHPKSRNSLARARRFPIGLHVYVIGSAESPLVKLGRSGNLDERLRQLQSTSPLLLSVEFFAPGAEAEETFLHHYFGPERRHGEWFDLGPDPVAQVSRALELFAAGAA